VLRREIRRMEVKKVKRVLFLVIRELFSQAIA